MPLPGMDDDVRQHMGPSVRNLALGSLVIQPPGQVEACQVNRQRQRARNGKDARCP